MALTTLLAVLFLSFLDTTIVTVALGSIQFDLGAGVIPLEWVVNAYSLVFACLMLAAGSIGDRFGRKPIMLVGIVIFCAGSVLCALASNVGMLIAGRAVMGLGAAASEPGTLSIIRHLYPDRGERAKAIGAWAAVSGLALALGPVIGGILVGAADWRAVFWFNVALGLVLFAATARFVPNSADPTPGRLDVAGIALGAVALGSAIFGGMSGEQYGYRNWWIIVLFVVAASAMAGFVLVEQRASNPTLELRYLKSPAVSSSLLAAFAVYFGVFSIFFFTGLYLDVVLGYSGWRLAATFTPMALAILLGSTVSGLWVAKTGPRAPLLTGCLASAVGILLTRHYLTGNPAFGALAAVLFIAGMGFGLSVVPLTDAVLSHVRPERSGMAASATNTARQLGAVIGVTALGAIVNSRITNEFGNTLSGGGKSFIIGLLETGGKDTAGFDIAHPPALLKPLVDAATTAFRHGVHDALLVAAVLVMISAIVTAVVPAKDWSATR